MIIEVSDAANPPGDLRPRTLRAAIAILLDPLEPGACVTIGGIRSLTGSMVDPQAIRCAVGRYVNPGRTHSVRHMRGGNIQIWRNK